MTRPGPLNLITDVEGITVGNAHDSRLKSGVTAILCERPAVASVHVMGGAPGTRETDLLAPENTVSQVDGLVLSGGSAFGLDAASGVQAWLRGQGKGFEVGGQRIPIVPAAILFDLVNGGDKTWATYPPYRELGFEAASAASRRFALGTAGAGHGATVARLKGGLGSASAVTQNGITVGALAAVNALGSPVLGETGHFWAAPFETGSEFGGLGLPSPLPADASRIDYKFRGRMAAGANTTIAVIATDAELTKAAAKRLAIAAHDGFARAIWPAHTPLDGDLVFSLATGRRATASAIAADMEEWIELSALAAATMARAIARAVYEATPEENDPHPAWKTLFG